MASSLNKAHHFIIKPYVLTEANEATHCRGLQRTSESTGSDSGLREYRHNIKLELVGGKN